MQREPFDKEDHSFSALLHRAVQRHWHHSSPCMSIHWIADEADGVLNCEAAPILQEILGGCDDGSRVWSPFSFDATGFATEPSIEIERVTVESACNACCRMAGVSIHGRLQDRPFALRVYEEPISSEPQEGLDAIKQCVVPIKRKPS